MTDYATMPAGPELDRLVAEKVMGWTLANEHGWSIKAFTNGRCISQGEVFESDENGFVGRMDFKPSSDIAHAWEVVERMANYYNPAAPGLWWNLITGFSIIPGFEDLRAENQMSLHSFTNVLALKPSLAPLAICRAALAAIS